MFDVTGGTFNGNGNLLASSTGTLNNGSLTAHRQPREKCGISLQRGLTRNYTLIYYVHRTAKGTRSNTIRKTLTKMKQAKGCYNFSPG